jgi:hypothetical protein
MNFRDRNDQPIKLGIRVRGADSNGSHAINLVPLSGTVTKLEEWGGVTIELDKPQVKYFRNGGGRYESHWYFMCDNSNKASRRQGDPFEHGQVEVYLEVD